MKVNYKNIFETAIDALKSEGRYRVFANIERRVGEAPYAYLREGDRVKKIIVWCSNDYLGMSHSPVVREMMQSVLTGSGAGAGGTRNISGTHNWVVALENELASLHKKEAALVFSSGYVANQTALSALGNVIPEVVYLSDSENHASMIEGIRHSKAEKLVFRHNDLEHLSALLEKMPLDRPKIVAFESIYSMSGSIGPVREIAAIARKYNALTYIDETHAVGLYGPQGGGVVEKLGLLDEIDCLQGGLGKGFGVVGGFVTGSASLIDVVRSYGAGFIFTTTMPPSIAAGALASVRYLRESSKERASLFEKAKILRKSLTEAGIPFLNGESHIVPVVVGDSRLCKRVSDLLKDQFNIYIQPINYPTVPRGTERLRVTVTPFHTLDMISDLTKALSAIWEELELPRSPSHTEHGLQDRVSSVAVAA